FDAYADIILAKDEYKKQLGLFVNTIVALYDSAKPEIYAHADLKKERDVLEYLRKVVERKVDQDEAIERAKVRINQLLDTSVVSQGDLTDAIARYSIQDAKQIDLSKLDFARLRAEFPKKKHPRVQFADLRELMEIKLKQMLAQNKTRGDFLARFQQVIDDYNSGSISIEEAYEALVRQAEGLSEEEQRAVKNNMTEPEQELFELLKKEKLTKAEEKEVKLAAKDLLAILLDAKNKILIQEWHKDKAAQERVRQEIHRILNVHLPDSYDRQLFSAKSDVVFRHFFELAESGGTKAA
ncbi:MAG: type I restriction enzyme endonuclease domain-containing protein, partial [Tunicatimonas sp.]